MSTSRLKPLIPHKISIDGTKSYRTFFKRHNKLIHTMEVDIYSSAVFNPMGSEIIKQSLIKLGKKTKNIQSLRLHKCLLQSKTKKDTKVQAIRKLYQNVKSLYISLNSPSQDLMRNYTKWLINSKVLKGFYFVLRKYVEEDDLQEDSFTFNLQRFLLALKRKKLETIKIMIEADYSEQLKPFLIFKNYPSTTKKLTLNWKDYGTFVSPPALPSEEPSLAHLKSLETLNLCIPLPAQILQDSLKTLPKSSNLIFTDIEPYNDSFLAPDNSLSLGTILQRFNHLNGLSIKINAQPGLSELLPAVLHELPLKKMKIEMLLESPEDLIRLGHCLGNFSQLESLILKIRNTKPIDFGTQSYFEDFFNQLAKLQDLNKLKLYFTILFKAKNTKKAKDFLPALSNCITRLKNLRQLSFRFRDADFVSSSQDLFNALMNNASEFKKLRINFGGQKLHPNDFETFKELLAQMPRLETLSLNEYYLDSKNILFTLLDATKFLKTLRTLKIVQMTGKIELTAVNHFIKEGLTKKDLHKFYLTCAQGSRCVLTDEIQENEKIDLGEVVRKNSALQVAYVPLDIFKNSDDIFLYKWA